MKKIENTLFSPDKFMKIEVVKRDDLFRLGIFLLFLDENGQSHYTPICGTGSSIFGNVTDATKEAQRQLEKYAQNPNLYR